jgi:replicative DNA helicase
MRAIEAEQELIGMALFDDSIMPLVEHVKPEHFAEPLHGRIWEICLDVSRAGRKISAIAMKPLLGDGLTRMGDDYLFRLVDKCGPVQSAGQFAAVIINAWQVRAISESVQVIDSATSAPEAFAYLRKQMDAIELAAGIDDGFVDAQSAADSLLTASESAAQTGKGLGMLCGLKCIDERLGGFQRGHLVVIGGRPAMGKTALADNLSYGVARNNPDQTFVFFNLEMDASELSARQLSAHAYMAGDYIPYRELKRPTGNIVSRLSQHRASLPKNLLICDQKRISVDDIRRIVWKLKAKREVGAVFIDYLQLMQMPSERGKTDAKIIAEATAELKRIAGEAQVCIVLLSQLNRGLEARDNKRPQMSDLRDSGGIEQDANAILFPYREYYYLKNEPPKDASKTQAWAQKCDGLQRVMTVICAKNRGGEVGDDELYCSLGYDVILNEPPYEAGGAAA